MVPALVIRLVPPSSGRYPRQPPLLSHASHSVNVTSHTPTAKGCPIITRCTGPSLSNRPSSSDGDPIRYDPAGTTTICGPCPPDRSASQKVCPSFHRCCWCRYAWARASASVWPGAEAGTSRIATKTSRNFFHVRLLHLGEIPTSPAQPGSSRPRRAACTFPRG